MQRVAYQLRIRPDKVEEYEEAHRHVWPELIQELQSLGVSDYSIFRQGLQLFLYLHAGNWNHVQSGLRASSVNRRWQQTMASLLEPGSGLQPDETLITMQEIFFMPGASAAGTEQAR